MKIQLLKAFNIVVLTMVVVVSSAAAQSVSVLNPTSSIRFPEGNNMSADHPDIALALRQDTTNLPYPFVNSMGPSSFFALVRLPISMRHTNQTFPIFGDGNLRVLAYGSQTNNSSLSNKLRFRIGTRSVLSQDWTEDAALIVAQRKPNSTYSIDWYSLKDGTKHIGTDTASAQPSGAWASSYVAIGGDTASAPSLDAPAWPGEIAAVGLVDGMVSEADWQNIAQGGDPISVIANSGSSLVWYRDLDGAASGLQPIVASDLTSASEVVYGVQEPGTDFVGKSTTQKLALESVTAAGTQAPGPLTSGLVIGLVPGQSSADVQFDGTALGYSGNVDIRLFYENTGNVLVDWTSLGAISSGMFSGVVNVPKCSDGWLIAQIRAEGDIVNIRDRFAVGYKILQLGQSQMGIYLFDPDDYDDHIESLNSAYAQTVSLLTNDPTDSSGNHLISIHRIGPLRESDGLASFVNQFRVFDPTTPVMIVDAAIHGTGPDQLMDDDLTKRQWSTLQQKLDQYGNDVSVVLMNWATQGWGTLGTHQETMEALLYGTGPAAVGMEHSLDASLQTGWQFGLSPATRYVDNLTGSASHGSERHNQIAFANANGIVVGPPVSDFQIESEGGPHQDSPGNVTMGSRMAITAARVLSLDSSVNAYFAGTAEFNAARTSITIPVSLPNGGKLSSPAPQGLRSFLVDDGGSTGNTSSGFSAEIIGSNVVLTKDSGTGAWQQNTTVTYRSDLEDRLDYDSDAEQDILAGALYETWSYDILDNGMPVLGTLSGGMWVANFSVVVDEAGEGGSSTTIDSSGNVLLNTDYSAYNSSQDGQYGHPTSAIIAGDGSSASLTGNAWKAFPLNYNVTIDTVLEFTINASNVGEIVGIALDSNSAPLDSRRAFLIGGSSVDGSNYSNWSWTITPLYTAGSGSISYKIYVGDYFMGSVNHIGLIADDDANGQTNVIYSDIKLYEDSGDPLLDIIDFETAVQTAYSGSQDGSGSVTVLDGGATLGLIGNRWRKIAYPYTVTPNTLIEFDVTATNVGELIGIGMDDDDDYTSAPMSTFKVAGMDGAPSTWYNFSTDYYDYSGGAERFVIPLGKYYTGAAQYLALIADDDANASANAMFSNVRVYEGILIDFDEYTMSSYSNQDITGNVFTSDGGVTITLTGNNWKQFDLDYTVTPETIIEFECYIATSDSSELINIGFDDDNDHQTGTHIFQIGGSDLWGSAIQDFNGQTPYLSIPIGEYYTGAMTHFVIAADDDGSSTANVTFKNIRLYEAQ